MQLHLDLVQQEPTTKIEDCECDELTLQQSSQHSKMIMTLVSKRIKFLGRWREIERVGGVRGSGSKRVTEWKPLLITSG